MITTEENAFAIKKYRVDTDVVTFYEEAHSFPHDVNAAFRRLKSKLLNKHDRQLYGIIENIQGRLIYKAAIAEEATGEGLSYACKYFIIPAGNYLSIVIKDWLSNLDLVEKAFAELREHPSTEGTTTSIEFYRGYTELVCMVKCNDIKVQLQLF